jgi:hypothetical protein
MPAWSLFSVVVAPGDASGRASHRFRLPVPDVVRITELDQVGAVGLCRQRDTRTVPRQVLNSRDGDQLRICVHILNQFPRCPNVQVSPEEVAVDVLERFPLPAPKPSIAPGRAITGKLAYLEPHLAAPVVAGKPTVQNMLPTALGDLTMTASAVYYVDWGDVETGPHAGPGGPWPNGNITHAWSNADVYDVEVTRFGRCAGVWPPSRERSPCRPKAQSTTSPSTSCRQCATADGDQSPSSGSPPFRGRRWR